MTFDYSSIIQVKMAKPVEIHLSTNSSLERAVNEVANTYPDWDRIARIFMSTNTYRRQGYASDKLPGLLSEIYLDLLLRDFAVSDQTVVHNPIPFNSRGNNYRFGVGRFGHYEVKELLSMRTYVEYDALTRNDGLITAWEITLKSRRHGGSKQNGRSISSSPLNAIFGYADQRLLPLHDYYGIRDLGYIVVVAADAYMPNVSSAQESFIQRGGHIVPLYADIEQIRRDISQISDRYGL